MRDFDKEKVVSVRIERTFDLEIRRLAVEKDLSRSALIREALFEKLEREGSIPKVVDEPNNEMKEV